ncbi:exosortase O [Pyxidicoccus xibeiensis]|uniref:exosortase O n=1 Tax=Pyxidicoccus xibeiensis TaxID=2906759 RepID=UPI0020A75545|nr:exosortase O [Pyxidicoccus xibeiensis]MCP3143207.1 exosortase O [Pyxidicoccus xibeiensis]
MIPGELTTAPDDVRPRAHALAALTANGALVVGLAALFAPTFRWLAGLLTHELRTSTLLFLFVALVLVSRAPRGLHRGFLRAPRVDRLPVVLLVGASALQVLVRRFLDVDLMSTALLLVALYGLAGFYLPGHLWRRAASGVALLVGVLPFGHHLEAYLGFPARLVAARIASGLLGSLGVANSGSESILVMENGLASVDLPCAGMKSLWVGALLTLALVAVQGRRLGWRLAAVLAAQASAMLGANAVRVTALSLVAVAAGRPDLASLIHTPLGLFGFLLVAGAAAWATVRWVPQATMRPAMDEAPVRASLVPPLLLASVLGLLTAVSSRRPLPPPVPAPLRFTLPAAFAAVPATLSAAEMDLFGRHGAAGARKVFFTWAGRRGSLLLVPATSWRAHHPAAQCLAASGVTLHAIDTRKLGEGFAVQHMELGPVPGAAVTWFQQGERTVATLAERILAGPFGDDAPWVMATVVLEGASGAPLVDAATEVRAAVGRAFEGVP